MRLDPDRLLMEHVFRPLTSRVHGRASNFDLARFCYLGAALFEGAVVAFTLTERRDTPAFWPQIIVGSLLVLLVVALNRASHVTEALARRGLVTSPYAPSQVALRYLWLIPVVFCGVEFVWFRDLGLGFSTMVLGCLGSGTYFAHCVMPPMRKARSRRLPAMRLAGRRA